MKNLFYAFTIFALATFPVLGSATPLNSGIKGTAYKFAQCPAGKVLGGYANLKLSATARSTSAKYKGTTDSNGDFSIALPPGSYTVRQTNGGTSCLWTGRQVTVAKGRYSSFKIGCHPVQNELCVRPPVH